MAIVRGDNGVVYSYQNGGWRPYACAKSCVLDVVTEFIETSTRGTGKSANYTPTKNSFTGSLAGLVNLASDSSLSLPDLRQKQLAQELLLLRFQRTDIDGNVYVDEANFYISESVDTSSYNDIASFTISLQGTGDIVMSFTPTPLALSAVTRWNYTAIGGEVTFGSTTLKGKQILVVSVDGKGLSEIVNAPDVPVDNQASYDTSTGFITIGVVLQADTKVYVLYQDILIEGS